MNIKLNKKQSFDPSLVLFALNKRILDSRFTAEVIPQVPRTIKILNVRIKSSKSYCARFLEGADWVEFDDLVNSVLDSLSVVANVSTSVCILRKGRKRRTYYDGSFGRFAEWYRDADDSDYIDYCGRAAPPSEFPEGTPGIYEQIGYNVVG